MRLNALLSALLLLSSLNACSAKEERIEEDTKGRDLL